MRALAGAFRGVGAWRAFESAMHASRTPCTMPGIHAWLDGNADHVGAEIAPRPLRVPRANGPVETLFQGVNKHLKRRGHRLTNRPRTLALLDLLVLGERRASLSEVQWAEIIREHLRAAGGRASSQRRNDDPRGPFSLVA